MIKAYRLLLTLCTAGAALTSCSRADYAFKPATPSYRGSVLVRAAVPAPSAAAVVATPALATKSAEAATATLEAPTPSRAVVRSVPAPAKRTLTQRVLTSKVLKQVAKAQVRQQNTAEAAQPASKLGRSLAVAGVGLLLLVLGGAAEIGLIAIIGLIAFIVGIVLAIVALVNGD